jgi:hypothetical protein
MTLLRTGAIAAALLLAAGLAPARADDPKPPAPPTPAAPAPASPAAPAPAGVVKIDIAETIEGKPSRENLAAYFIRKKLREAGFTAWSARPIHADELQKKSEQQKPAAGATPPSPAAPAAPGDEKPAPDLVVKGTVDIEVSRVSTFYGQNVAFAYTATTFLEVQDKAGKSLAKIEDKDEWGQTSQRAAREQCMKRMALFASADVLKSEPIRGRLSEKAKAEADAFVAGIEKKRHPEAGEASGGTGAPGEGGEGGK